MCECSADPERVASDHAFCQFRQSYGELRQLDPAKVTNSDQVRQMTSADGMKIWKDGTASTGACTTDDPPPLLDDVLEAKKQLWVIGKVCVRYAPEKSPFGDLLTSGEIKHSNLTGGAPAYAGGELIFIDEDTIILNGKSGRYGPRSANELEAAVLAFRQSGYYVWYMGYDTETDRPFPFVGATPEWIW